jgi:hypothetical protein
MPLCNVAPLFLAGVGKCLLLLANKNCVIHIYLLPYIMRPEFGTYRHYLLTCVMLPQSIVLKGLTSSNVWQAVET